MTFLDWFLLIAVASLISWAVTVSIEVHFLRQKVDLLMDAALEPLRQRERMNRPDIYDDTVER